MPLDSTDRKKRKNLERILSDLVNASVLGSFAQSLHYKNLFPAYVRKFFRPYYKVEYSRYNRPSNLKLFERFAPPGTKIDRSFSVLGGPAYGPGQKTFYNFTTAGIEEAAHELGHARIHHKLKGAYPALTGAGRFISEVNPAILGVGAYHYLRNKKEDPKKAKRWRNWTLGLSGLGALIPLLDEAEASRRGIKMLKETNLFKPQHAHNLRKAWESYAVRYGAPVAAAATLYGLDAWRDRLKRRRAEKKDAPGQRMV